MRDEPTERDALVAALRERGIRFLAPSDARPSSEPLSDAALVRALVRQADPRLRLSLIAWFILQPRLHRLLPALCSDLPPRPAAELQALYTAAVDLQRLWWTRLSFYLAPMEPLPDLFSAELGLPSPLERHGKVGLQALAEWHTALADPPVNRLAAYHKTMTLLFDQLRRAAPTHAPTTG